MALNHEVTGSVNYTIVGSPTIVDGVVSGFSGSDYLSIGSLNLNNDWEITCAFTYKQSSKAQYLIGASNWYSLGPIVFTSGKCGAWVVGSVDGTALSGLNNISTYILEDGKKYIVSTKKQGRVFSLIVKSGTGQLLDTKTSTIPSGTYSIPTLVYNIGWFPADSAAVASYIDLNQTYIKINGQAWFGNCPVEVKHIDYGTSVGYTKVGSPTIINGVVSGFSADDYLTLPSPESFPNNTFNGLDIQVKAKVETLNGWQGAIHWSTKGASVAGMLGFYNGKLYCLLGRKDNETTQNVSIVSTFDAYANTYYWLKIIGANGSVTFSYSIDGQSFTSIGTVSDATGFSISHTFGIGHSKISSNSFGYFSSGSIDLNETYIKVNGKLWFYKPCTNYLVKDGKLIWADSGLYLTGPNNYTKAGSPTIVDGVASGFSASNYLTTSNFPSDMNKLEVKFVATINSVASHFQAIYYSNSLAAEIRSDGRAIRIRYLNSGGTVSFIGYTATDFQYDVPIEIYATWENSYLTIVTKQAGVQLSTNTVEAQKPSNNLRFGTDTGSSNFTDGSIDLNNTYIKVNDDLWFYGKNYASQNIAPVPSGYHFGDSQVRLDKVGDPTIVDGVASGFSTSDYLTLGDNFRPGNNTWEIGCKFTTGTMSSSQMIYSFTKALSNAGRYGLSLYINTNQKFTVIFTLDGSSFFGETEPNYTLTANTTYWTKEYWDGTAFKLDVSTDRVNYQNIANIPSSTPIYNGFSVSLFGVWNNGAFLWPFDGSIDLKETYIKINNKMWFDGSKAAAGVGWFDMRTQKFTGAPAGATLGKDE